MSGYFVLRRKCISDINFNRPVSSLLLDILARGQIRSVTEVPSKLHRAASERARQLHDDRAFKFLHLHPWKAWAFSRLGDLEDFNRICGGNVSSKFLLPVDPGNMSRSITSDL
jgi:hypothetical protein